MKPLFIIFTLFILTSCAAILPVDTLNKRMTAFEITYQETLKTAINLRDQGYLDVQAQDAIDQIVTNIETVRGAAYSAIALGNTEVAESKLGLAASMLSMLSDILKQKGGSHAKFYTSDRSFDLIA